MRARLVPLDNGPPVELVKDLTLAVAAADSDLEVVRAALDQAHRTLAAGHADEDFASITGHIADEGEAGGF